MSGGKKDRPDEVGRGAIISIDERVQEPCYLLLPWFPLRALDV